MKKLNLLILLIAVYHLSYGQSQAEIFKKDQLKSKNLIATELSQQFLTFNFSKLWTHTDNSQVFGFIGDNYQRIRVKIINIAKSKILPNTYDVYGKTMVKGNIDDFTGIMSISNIRKCNTDDYKKNGVKGLYVLVGNYNLLEGKMQPHSGVFKGVFSTGFYIDKQNHICYDDLEKEADDFENNQFVGTWTPYGSSASKICNWGDYRIQNSKVLDGGAGEFYPDDKYLGNGWLSLRDYLSRGGNNKKAQAIEEAKWWK